MNSLLALLLLCSACVNVPQSKLKPTGSAYHYRPGLFAIVAHNRHMPLLWGHVTSFVSVPNCRLVNAKKPWVVYYYLKDGKSGKWGKLETGQVVDCTAKKDIEAQTEKGIVPGGLEVDWSTAKRYHFNYPPLDGKTDVAIVGYWHKK